MQGLEWPEIIPNANRFEKHLLAPLHASEPRIRVCWSSMDNSSAGALFEEECVAPGNCLAIFVIPGLALRLTHGTGLRGP